MLSTCEGPDTKLDPRVSVSPSHKLTQVASFLLELIEEEMESHRDWVTCQCLGASAELGQSPQMTVCTSKAHLSFQDSCVCVRAQSLSHVPLL